ncbi:hypothetical protein [Deinococcus sonorensis]|uniref:Uncharacterized protein n=2 Tax=Deinococcus sonorensis TaxID=309891 RepID=A0AAU7UFV8_9DEIO
MSRPHLHDLICRTLAETARCADEHPHPQGQVRLEYLKEKVLHVSTDLDCIELMEMARRLRLQFLSGSWELN